MVVGWNQIWHLCCVDLCNGQWERADDETKLHENDEQVNKHPKQCQLQGTNNWAKRKDAGETQDQEHCVDAVKVVDNFQEAILVRIITPDYSYHSKKDDNDVDSKG